MNQFQRFLSLSWTESDIDSLATFAESTVLLANNLRLSNYSSVALLAASYGMPFAPSSTDRDSLPHNLEAPSSIVAAFAARHGATLSDASALDTQALDVFAAAWRLIAHCQPCWYSVKSLALSIHMLDAENDAIDVSFSDPELPLSIFISTPRTSEIAPPSVRVAEAILHETFHLQLGLVDAIWPLFRANHPERYSPWRKEVRNAEGILHGLYVFRMIELFWMKAALTLQGNSLVAFAKRRVHEIAQQLASLEDFAESSSLTAVGAAIAAQLLDRSSTLSADQLG